MTTADERALCFEVDGDDCLAILHDGDGGRRLGVVIVVGGPQYRVGSHRQFVLLARRLAAAGYPVLRFDFRGSGDSAGELRDFESIGPDIDAAITATIASSGIEGVVLWGLCDAASAILMHATSDRRVAGVVLLNPWVHSAETEARARLKTYYGARLRNPEFWRKVLRFELDWRDSLGSLLGYVKRALGFGRSPPAVGETTQALPFVERMRRGWACSVAPTLLVLSGDDLTAEEFRDLAGNDPGWRALRERADVTELELAAANHTFARADWRREAEDATLAWLQRLDG